MDPKELREMAKLLRESADDYDSLASRMENGGVASIEESGRATFLKITLPSIRRNIRRIAGRLEVRGV